MNKVFSIAARRIVFQNIRLLYCGHCQVKFYHNIINHYAPINGFSAPIDSNLHLIKRLKHKKKGSAKKMQEDIESDEEDEEDELEEYESKSKNRIITTKVSSLRIDYICKAGLGITRKKIEEAFYDSKIRVNGNKVFKLSTQVRIGDEIDFIRGRSEDNSNLLIVSRVTVLSIEPASDSIKVKFSRDKSLLIEEYSQPWND